MVHGAKIHYREAGPQQGDPVLFVHGNPASSYLWRNIIPAMPASFRCIAIDLVGMGRSDKPAINYRLLDHYKYFEGFIEQLGLRNLTLVVHDWGSALGFLHHARHPESVKRIAFMEALLKPYPSWEGFPRPSSPPAFSALFRSFRGESGRAVLIDSDTNFIDFLVRPVTGTELSMDDLNEYWIPFMNREYREPVWRWPNEIPVANDPPDVAIVVEEYSEALKRSTIPKLLIYHANGVITAEAEVEWCRANLKNLEVVRLEGDLPGPIHFLQERFPGEIASSLTNWLQKP
jgi:haloalkane dehalogenase